MSLRCPGCRSLQVDVIDSRPQADHTVRYRRLRCNNCRHRFSTREHLVDLDKGAKGARALKALEEALNAAREEIRRLMRED
jgi:transcriptional regulator NrdR family protein